MGQAPPSRTMNQAAPTKRLDQPSPPKSSNQPPSSKNVSQQLTPKSLNQPPPSKILHQPRSSKGLNHPPPPPSDVATNNPQKPPILQIPPDRERNFRRKPGFDYLLVTIEFQKGKKFGLGMVDTENRVLINKVDDDSMCSEVLKSLDRICDVEGIPVTDKELCKKQIVKGLKVILISYLFNKQENATEYTEDVSQ
ncbi:hypothetical protein ANCCAN_28729 [Ancylostoma caninum]|uniref:PDZ domain-containing protein n=1 Tax=Ancylostoma caninum TaxID=29170 RepID=A0A368F1N3_ANCCA|nr:hypothetical protein ANCCAN_28729 [Ancylostoma caninum]